MATNIVVPDFLFGDASAAPLPSAVNFFFGSETIPGPSLSVVMSAGEGWNPTLYLPDPMVAEIRLEFKKPYAEPDPDAVRLVFGDRGDTSFTEIEVSPYGHGEALDVVLTLPMTLGTVEFSTGETIVEMRRELKDPRLYPAVLAMAQPFSNGWAFLSSSQPTWPPGYTQSIQWHHFYGQAEGMGIDFPRPQLLVTPAWVLTEIFGPGGGFYPVYAATNGSISMAAGETLVPALRLEFVSVGRFHSTGETLTLAFSTLRRLAVAAGHGEEMRIDIQVMSMRTEVFTGEAVSLTLDVYDLVNVPAFTGETLSTDLTTSAAMVAVAWAGENFSLTLTAHPAAYMAVSLANGEAAVIPLDTKQEHRFALSLGDGQTATPSLFLPSRADIGFTAWSGESFEVSTISTAIGLGEVVAWTGSSMLVMSLDELSNYRAADGVSLSATIVALPYFSSTAADGVTLSVSVDTRPPAGLSCTLWEGAEFAFPSMNLLVSAPLRVTFGEGVYITATESTSTTSFDLEGDPVSYPNRLQWWLDMNQFEFIDMLPSFVWGHGTGIVVQADLQARPRFSISCATGESFAMVRGYDYMEIEAFSGLQAPTQEFIHLEPHVNLCYPNVIPNADAMEVELDFNEETCYADFLYEGQYLRSALSCVYTVAPVQWVEGSRLDFDLTISDLWRLRFWTGQRLEFYLGTVPVLPINFSTGEAFRGTFEEPSVLMHAGESVELELTITFEVEFLERGCLDNEYKYMTPNGDEDKEKFNPVAVELEPFAHEIKARCF